MAERALLIGAGGIGALYDLDRPEVWTHARAYASLGIGFDVLDQDHRRAERICERYGGRPYQHLREVDLGSYRAVSVCSSTDTHAGYLLALLPVGVPLIFCEKPVARSLDELRAVGAAQRASRSLVLVNYLRRFLPPYRRLRQALIETRAAARLQSAVVRYQRGFLNNGSHALDLMEFLLDRPIDLASLKVARLHPDAFAGDPTVTGTFDHGEATVMLVGFPTDQYGIFELELNFQDRRVQILDRGDRLVCEGRAPEGKGLQPDLDLSAQRCLQDYMLPVFREGLALASAADPLAGNFQAACRLNMEMARALDALSEARPS